MVPSFPADKKKWILQGKRENKVFYNTIIPSEDIKRFELNQYRKFNKAPLFVNADLECLIEKIGEYKNNSENSFTKKLDQNIQSGFVMSTMT